MEKEPLFSINWTNSVTNEICCLQICGSINKIDQVVYSCSLNNQIIEITNIEGRWIDYNGRDDKLASKLGLLLISCDFLLEANIGMSNIKA